MMKTIDLCAGIGGIRKGFELTGDFSNVLSAEIDKYAIQTYRHLYNEDPSGDITDREFKNKILKTDFNVLLAGFPCQSFSRAGTEKGFLDDTRGTIFFDIAEIIKENKPEAFLLENVDNLLSHDKGKTIQVILNVLINELDYTIVGVHSDNNGGLTWNKNSLIRNSKSFGMPQNRPRVYLMGFNNKAFFSKIEKQDIQSILGELPKTRRRGTIYNNLNDVLEKDVPKKYYLASGMLQTLEKHKNRHKSKGNGFGYMIVNSPDIENPISNALLATGGSGKERNLILDSNKYAGETVPNKHTPINNVGIRNMTPTEWGKLQGFINYAFIDDNGVDNFSFPDTISDTQQYKQFGNSVTIPVIEEMAYFMSDKINCLGGIK
ncbi:DNA (cytosine-5)-methyltransferase 1 [Enterococcus sp. DIV1314a]